MKKYDPFYYERLLWEKGIKKIAGADEVGRGSLAGPVVCGVVVLPFFLDTRINIQRGNKHWEITKESEKYLVNDSKKLTSFQRQKTDGWIKENAIVWATGEASVGEINKSGIVKATCSAFRRAIRTANKNLKSRVQFMLIDAFYIPYIAGIPMGRKFNQKVKGDSVVKGKQLAIVKGDTKSISIAAASIIAKVYRDRLMENLAISEKNIIYKWEKNKGYGTKEHKEALIQYGPTKHHRKKFITFISKVF